MATDYNKIYGETPDALGPPTQAFVDFFDRYGPGPAGVLDIGCGQGRDALFIARRGHHVVGVDLSPNGIRDLTRVARAENLAVQGIVADITQFKLAGSFDILLIDRTLHMLPALTRLSVFAGLLGHVRPGGWLLLADEPSNIPDFRTCLDRDSADWRAARQKRGLLFVQRDADSA